MNKCFLSLEEGVVLFGGRDDMRFYGRSNIWVLKNR